MPADIEVDFDVELTEEEIQKKIKILGELIAQEMRKLAIKMGLVEGGDYSQGFFVFIKAGVLMIENRVKYAKALEFGTFEYFKRFGNNKFPSVPDPKKKDMSSESRKNFPKGMQPFAVMRRVLYNRNLMTGLIQDVFG